MNDLTLTEYSFDPKGYFQDKIDISLQEITADWVNIFDQNGYILTKLEQQYYNRLTEHRGPWEHSFQKPWFIQSEKWDGAVLNHSLLFQRKGFAGAAFEELSRLANFMPILWKVAKIRPKWGLDFSVDWTDKEGNVFEILHWEWDSFNYEEVQEKKLHYQQLFLLQDWTHVAQKMLAKKDEWYHLDFFGQSAWKCTYLGIEHEQFKMVCWQ
jgi:hypothetical protein